jgi:plastocyanin
MFRFDLRIGIVSALLPFALVVGCGGSASNTDARKDAKTDAATGGTAGGGTGGGTGGAGTGGSGGIGTGGSGGGTGGSGGTPVDAAQDVPRDVPAADVRKDVVADVPAADVRDAGVDHVDAPADTGADASADTAAEASAETAAEAAAETANDTPAETAPETAAETAAETATETTTDTGNAFVSIVPCTAAGNYTTTDTTINFRVDPNGYDPACVKIPKGGSVTFNGTFSSHPLEPRTTTGGSPNNPITLMNTGTTHTITFPNAGYFPYHCNIHASMIGVIQVTE